MSDQAPDDRFVVSASLDTTIKVWDLTDQTLKRTLRGHEAAVSDLVIIPAE